MPLCSPTYKVIYPNVTYLTTTLVGRSRYCPISTILGILFEIVKTLMFIQNIKNKIVCILVVIICQQS